ncbi:hypothetical protein FNV43_RR13385 [Rhamnella rubrinervis]|uniref:Ionotropic glutamate receptor C-terminal domain-containing protein n=1 Tax=Rhamnella rubrinervis TaxID=2594499 RepID=A0A8K0H123_9ROSA|nr:hypothetical protein FNV43_RR13385 [Rhamnella rubrinervis]
MLGVLQGIVTMREHTPESSQKQAFVSRWRKMFQQGLASPELNSYGLYAYDTVWTVAHAIDSFINEQRNIPFSLNDKLLHANATESQLGKLKVFDGGSLLLGKLLETNFTGLTGQVRFDQDRNIVGGGYDVININQMIIRSVDDDKPLRIGVPKRASFREFVTEYSNHSILGYCIDVFNEARKFVPYNIPYRFMPFGDGQFNPNYTELVKMVANNVFDAAVGDIAIVKNRTKIVDFSQPYVSTGLVIMVPIKHEKPSAWVFLKPFTLELWCVIAASFVIIAVVMWTLEHRVNNDFRGPPKRQLATMFLFSFSTLFKKNQEDTVSPFGRLVMVVWLFLLMVITSSYTASLTSILTIQQLSSPINGIDSLVTSNLPIGYQVGSFAYSYLIENLSIQRSRLISLASAEEYESALLKGPAGGGVAAIIDELPYVELFMSKHSGFEIIGQSFTRSGWGFAFQRDSALAVDMSTAILKLSETGELQKIYEKWFCKMGCPDESRLDSEPNQLRLISFWGLYLLCGVVSLGSLVLFMLQMIYQFVRCKRKQIHHPSSESSVSLSTQYSQVIFNFFKFVDEKEEAIKKVFTQGDNPQVQVG